MNLKSLNAIPERLKAFENFENVSLVELYEANLQLSEALYPALATLEVTLRNAIDLMLCNYFGENWLFEEIKKNKFLRKNDHKKLLFAYNCLTDRNSQITKGRLIAELNLGFWVNICSKRYNPIIWYKQGTFYSVFVNYPRDRRIALREISEMLQSIKHLRNRVFHFEPIYKKGENLLGKYNEILTILSYLPVDEYKIFEHTCRFKDVYNRIKTKNAGTLPKN